MDEKKSMYMDGNRSGLMSKKRSRMINERIRR